MYSLGLNKELSRNEIQTVTARKVLLTVASLWTRNGVAQVNPLSDLNVHRRRATVLPSAPFSGYPGSQLSWFPSPQVFTLKPAIIYILVLQPVLSSGQVMVRML